MNRNQPMTQPSAGRKLKIEKGTARRIQTMTLVVLFVCSTKFKHALFPSHDTNLYHDLEGSRQQFEIIIIRVSPFQLHCPAPALLSTVLFSKLSHHISRVEDYYSGRAPTLLRPTATSTRFSSRFIEYAKLSFFQLCLKIRGG